MNSCTKGVGAPDRGTEALPCRTCSTPVERRGLCAQRQGAALRFGVGMQTLPAIVLVQLRSSTAALRNGKVLTKVLSNL